MLMLSLPAVDPLTLVAAAPAALCGAIVAAGFVVAFLHDPGRPATPDWRHGELSKLVLPTGEHELIGARAFEQIADYDRYVPRHDWDTIPPCMRTPAWRMTAAERARALTTELGNWRWRPARPYRTGVLSWLN